MEAAWTRSADHVLQHFGVNPSAGLSQDAVRKHQELYGKNEIQEEPPTPIWELILEQFKDQLVLILLASAVISFVLALFEDNSEGGILMAFVEPAVILLILVANATVGVIQETKAEKAIDALKEYTPNEAKAVRNGFLTKIDAAELVPGDIISIAVGDRIPADCRLLSISSSSFRVDQAILTGESESVSKSLDIVQDERAVKQDMKNMVFSGTSVVNGIATAIVVNTGSRTAIGDIHTSISTQINQKTPLKQKLDDFGDMLAKVITVICILVWVVNYRNFSDPAHHGVIRGAIYYFKIAVALAVAAIPEGLAAMMSILAKRKDKGGALLVKGAPESVLERCTHVQLESGIAPLSQQLKAAILDRMAVYSKDGLRTLALAYSDKTDLDTCHYQSKSTAEYARFERDLVFVSLVGMLDPPRPEVRGAVARCKAAGIRIICVTGDNKGTAEAICRNVGIFDADEDTSGKSYTGKEFDALTQDEKIEAVKRAKLFSRTEPSHKSQLVDLLQQQGLVVAMTGDGVNDAPALKKADIGVAMGSGTQVAQMAADMILADSNFATIEKAVEEGRLIYNNTKQFIRYLISSNIGEVVSIFLTVILGMPEALIPVQLLWVNLVTDSLPATALGFNKADHAIMRVSPRSSKEPLVGKWLFFRYLVIGTYVGCATVFGYAWWFMFYEGGPQITWYQLTHFHSCSARFPEIGCAMFTNEMAKSATTMSLSILVVVEMFNAMNSLSENESLLVLPLWSNWYLIGAITLSMLLHVGILYVPFFTNLFAITPLNWTEWRAVLLISCPVIVIDEGLKFVTVRSPVH
ncbi:hypothetical protein FRC20_004813 [Serendipita sp. 405]|nr:hypothetical protein FRC20_004813 [Serendipita sp. 405]